MDKEKAIWLFAGGEMQNIAARKIIQKGYKLILTDMNYTCFCSEYADELITLDTFDISGNINAATELLNKYKIEAVLTAAADCHETVAGVAKSLGLHGISPYISHICRYKHLTRDVLTKAGIPQPAFKVVKDLEQARQFIGEIGGAGVLKATNNSGSRGFALIRNIDKLNKAAFENSLASGTTGQVLVEEIIKPVENEIAEQSVETVWYDGKMYWLNWVDRLFRKDFRLFDCLQTGVYSDVAWGVELGHINPAVHEYRVKKEVYDMIYRAGRAIGMHKENGGHILKADIMLTENGPYIIELTPRLSGGWDSLGSTPARAADFAGGVIHLALGSKLDVDIWHKYFEYKDPNLYASVLARIDRGAEDCIGRAFSIGVDYNRENSIQNAFNNLMEENHVIRLEQ